MTATDEDESGRIRLRGPDGFALLKRFIQDDPRPTDLPPPTDAVDALIERFYIDDDLPPTDEEWTRVVEYIKCIKRYWLNATWKYEIDYWRPRLDALEGIRQQWKPTPPAADSTASSAATGRGTGEGAETGEPPNASTAPGDSTNRYAVLEKLAPAHRTAYFSFLFAEGKVAFNRNARRLQDRDAWDWLKENGIDVEKGSELADYVLPDFLTWCRYLRAARKALGEQKHRSRYGRERGKSIIRGQEDDPKGDDE